MTSVAQLNSITSNIVLYVTSICFVLGIFGLSLNLILFTRRTFRNNPCAMCYLASTFVNLILILLNNPLTVVKYIFNIDILASNVFLCKLFRYIFWMSRSLSVWLIVLASADRYATSSSQANRRAWSSMKNAKRFIFIITITVTIIYSHMLIFYQLFYSIDSSGNVSAVCNPQVGFYAVFSAFLHLAMYNCIPVILMITFGILTMMNIRRQRRLIQPRSIHSRALRQRVRLNNQLLKMLFAQILVVTISTVPLSAEKIYESWTGNLSKTAYTAAQDRLFAQGTLAFSYLAHSTNFYLYTLSGTIFRQELKRLLIKFIHYFCCVTNHIRANA